MRTQPDLFHETNRVVFAFIDEYLYISELWNRQLFFLKSRASTVARKFTRQKKRKTFDILASRTLQNPRELFVKNTDKIKEFPTNDFGMPIF